MNIFAGYYFNCNAVFPGISSFAILTTGLIIFLQNTRSAINRFFLLSCLSLFVWLSGLSMVYLSKEAALALPWFKYYSSLGVVSIAPNVYFFNRAVAKRLKSLTPWFIFNNLLIPFFMCWDLAIILSQASQGIPGDGIRCMAVLHIVFLHSFCYLWCFLSRSFGLV